MVLKDNLEKAHEVFKDNKSKLIFAALFTLIIKFSLSLTPEYDYLEMSDNLSSSSVQDLRKTELSKAMDSIDNITSSLQILQQLQHKEEDFQQYEFHFDSILNNFESLFKNEALINALKELITLQNIIIILIQPIIICVLMYSWKFLCFKVTNNMEVSILDVLLIGCLLNLRALFKMVFVDIFSLFSTVLIILILDLTILSAYSIPTKIFLSAIIFVIMLLYLSQCSYIILSKPGINVFLVPLESMKLMHNHMQQYIRMYCIFALFTLLNQIIPAVSLYTYPIVQITSILFFQSILPKQQKKQQPRQRVVRQRPKQQDQKQQENELPTQNKEKYPTQQLNQYFQQQQDLKKENKKQKMTKKILVYYEETDTFQQI